MDSPAIIEDLASEPILAHCKLIAASANDALLPRSGERGFPHYGVVLEWNNRFGADMLALLRDNKRECVWQHAAATCDCLLVGMNLLLLTDQNITVRL